MAASILTLYMNEPMQSTSSAGLLDMSAPAASTSVTGWTVNKTAAGRYNLLTFGEEVSGFGNTPEPDAEPNQSDGAWASDCYRLSDATTGTFSAGTWWSAVSVIGVTSGGDQDGAVRFRVWRSSSASCLNPTEITQGTMEGTQVFNLSTTVAQTSSASTQVAEFDLTNEFLFLQVAWRILGAGGANGRDVLIRYGPIAHFFNGVLIGSGLKTSAFSAHGGGGGGGGDVVSPHYYRMTQQWFGAN